MDYCLPKELFIPKDILSQLTCSIGLGIFNEPVALPCQHIFCRRCVEGWLEKHQNCPKCRTPCNKESTKTQWIFQSIIQNSQVKCSNTGCPWTGIMSGLGLHLKSACPETLVDCPEGCGLRLKRGELSKHAAICERRKVLCQYCGTTIPFCTQTQHETECSGKIVTCPYGCGASLKVCEVEYHKKEVCKSIPLPCKYQKYVQCEFSGVETALKAHYQDAMQAHLIKVAEIIGQLKAKIELLEKSKRDSLLVQPFITGPSYQNQGGGMLGLIPYSPANPPILYNPVPPSPTAVPVVWSIGDKKLVNTSKKWGFCLSKTMIPANFMAKIKVATINPSDSNAWKLCIGVFSSDKYLPGNWEKHKNGWGYILGNGSKVHDSGAEKYGEPYAIGDTIGILVKNKTLSFYRNDVCQGEAYKNLLSSSFYLAVALSGQGHAVEILEVVKVD